MSPLQLDHVPMPESSDSGTVEAALEALKSAHDESTAHEAYDAFLWAIGNNHAGTFYPVVLGVLPQLEQILLEGNVWAKRAVMESLIDLGGSFIPEEGHQRYLGTPVQETLQAFIHSMRRHIAPLAVADGPCANSASDLLELIDDQSA